MTKRKQRQKQKDKELQNAINSPLLSISTLLLIIIDYLTLIEITRLDKGITNKVLRKQYIEMITLSTPQGLNRFSFHKEALHYGIKRFNCKNLISLQFKFGVEDSDINLLSSLMPFKSMKHLNLTYMDLLSDQFIASLIQNSPSLIALDLSGALNVSTRTFAAMKTIISQLQVLHLSQVKQISMTSINETIKLSRVLRVLNLSWTVGVNDQLLKTIETHLKCLVTLLLISQHDITETAVRNLCDKSTTLKEIHLEYCRQITTEFVQELNQRGIKATL